MVKEEEEEEEKEEEEKEEKEEDDKNNSEDREEKKDDKDKDVVWCISGRWVGLEVVFLGNWREKTTFQENIKKSFRIVRDCK